MIDLNVTTHFVALTDFSSDEFKSQYLKGMSYKVRPGNEKLAKAVEQWIADGKVQLSGVTTGAQGLPEQAQIDGKGD